MSGFMLKSLNYCFYVGFLCQALFLAEFILL